ncbi:MAG: hypothetical protein JG782_298 [Anaerophaga sp.]|jgi:hypothetical protein|nr:hypothetical protein [Anaerophaga sp.]MDI3520400.1 hypothetical protein [Anaerophaga sp.]MDK2840556.1 hypothetical protein [Anaerophaga sp.]MDN5290210.1 hypothetical protein [Anaerophaga sp.]
MAKYYFEVLRNFHAKAAKYCHAKSAKNNTVFAPCVPLILRSQRGMKADKTHSSS